jgi:hypothetical protein
LREKRDEAFSERRLLDKLKSNNLQTDKGSVN